MLTYNTDSITIGDGIASVCLPACLPGLDVGVPSAALAFAVRCFSTLAQLECSRHGLEHAMCVSMCVCVCVCDWVWYCDRVQRQLFCWQLELIVLAPLFYSPPQQQANERDPGTATTSSRTDSSCTYVRRPLRCSIQRSCSKYPWRSRSNNWNSFC